MGKRGETTRVSVTDPHHHGIRTTYTVHGCRCDECREANRLYRAESRARAKAGDTLDRRTTRPGRVDTDAAVDAITRARAAGASVRGLARVAGVSDGTIRKVLAGELRRLTTEKNAAILAACKTITKP